MYHAYADNEAYREDTRRWSEQLAQDVLLKVEVLETFHVRALVELERHLLQEI